MDTTLSNILRTGNTKRVLNRIVWNRPRYDIGVSVMILILGKTRAMLRDAGSFELANDAAEVRGHQY